MVPAWDGVLGQIHDHDHEDKQRIIWISIWNIFQEEIKKEISKLK